MPKPTAVSVFLMAFILANTIAESASWSKKSTHYRTRGERRFVRPDFRHHLTKRGPISFRNVQDENRQKGKVWWLLPQNFSPRILDINDKVTFIENFTDYPGEMLRQLMKREGREHGDIFGEDPLTQKPDLRTRIGPQETKLCPSLEQIVYPKVALSKNNEWKYVVNVGEEFVQGVRVETCGHFDKCSLSDSFPAGYTAMCEQKYVFRRLLSVADKGKPIVEEFRMPSCCSCIVKGPSEG